MTTPDNIATEKKRFLRAYYHTFETTGVDAADAVLEAVALAGEAYHHTEQWDEAEDHGEDGYWSLIQRRAQSAADTISALHSPNEKLRGECEAGRAYFDLMKRDPKHRSFADHMRRYGAYQEARAENESVEAARAAEGGD